jgi:hypothetical protein
MIISHNVGFALFRAALIIVLCKAYRSLHIKPAKHLDPDMQILLPSYSLR